MPYNVIVKRTYDVLPDGGFVVTQRPPIVPEAIVVVLNALGRRAP